MKKGNFSITTIGLIILSVVLAVFVLLSLVNKLPIVGNNLFSIMGMEKKCSKTGISFAEYKERLDELFIASKGGTTDKQSLKDMTELCDGLKLCFPKEYSIYKERCDGLSKLRLNPLSCGGPGEIIHKDGTCVCDAASGWTSKSDPWKSFKPPCKFFKDGSSRYAIDNTLTNGDPGDEGLCICYYSMRYYEGIKKNSESGTGDRYKSILDDLDKYSHEEGFVKKVYSNALDTAKKISKDGDGIVNRSQCYTKVASSNRAVCYGIFYTEYLNNLRDGYSDDSGLCVSFDPTEETQIISIMEDLSRETCLSISKSDPSYKYSFFVVDKGDKPMAEIEDNDGNGNAIIEGNPDFIISTHYSPDFYGKKDGISFTEQYIKDKCTGFKDYDLIFITGVEKTNGDFDVRGTACQYEITMMRRNNLIGQKPRYVYRKFDNLDGKNLCCYANEV